MAVQILRQHKYLRVAGVAVNPTGATELTEWMFEGDPSFGATPTTWANPNNTTQGGLQQAAVAAPYTQQWLHDVISQGGLGMGAWRFVLYDRLGHMGGLSGTVTTAQNVNGGSPGAVTRWGPSYAGAYTNPDAVTGDGNEILVEVYSALGGTPATVTATYTNSQGVASQVTQAVNVNRTIYSVTRLPLAQGDTGVQSVTSVTLSGSTGTAGNFGVVIAHRYPEMLCGNLTPDELAPTFSAGGPVEILSGACLYFTGFATVTPSGQLNLADHYFVIVDA